MKKCREKSDKVKKQKTSSNASILHGQDVTTTHYKYKFEDQEKATTTITKTQSQRIEKSNKVLRTTGLMHLKKTE